MAFFPKEQEAIQEEEEMPERISTAVKKHCPKNTHLINKTQTLIFEVPHQFISSLIHSNNNNPLFTNMVFHPFNQMTLSGFPHYCAGTYNGVICIHFTTLNFIQHLYLWNPVTQQSRPIPVPPIFIEDRIRDVSSLYQKRYWFGYVDALKDVIIFHAKRTTSFVFSLTTNVWRQNPERFEIGPDNMAGKSFGSRFVLKGGALYIDPGLEDLVKFDLMNNGRFERVPSMWGGFEKRGQRVQGSILGATHEKNNKLCLGRIIKKNNKQEMLLEIFVRSEGRRGRGYWERESVTSLGVEASRSFMRILGFTYDGKVFVGGLEKMWLVDPITSTVRGVENRNSPMYTLSYVGTSVSPYHMLPN